MSSGRTVIALVILFVGVMALLLLRYDPHLFTAALANPLITVPAVGILAAIVGIWTTHRVPDPKRAVVFYDERFDRIDPRGRFSLLPGIERIGAEISLAEHRVLSASIHIFDVEGKAHQAVFSLAWRLVPTASRPTSERERRVLLMTNPERQRIVLQTLEDLLREQARCMKLDALTAYLTTRENIERLRTLLSTCLREDVIYVDRLHLVNFVPAEKKKDDAPLTARETRTSHVAKTWRQDGDARRLEIDRTDETTRGLVPAPKPENAKPGDTKPGENQGGAARGA
ncbi:MAG TPA: hypothetical protein VIC85_10065 [Ktedonobacterales bacterium]|jgi:hypothetical protein